MREAGYCLANMALKESTGERTSAPKQERKRTKEKQMKHENPPPPHNLILLTKNVINEPVFVCVLTLFTDWLPSGSDVWWFSSFRFCCSVFFFFFLSHFPLRFASVWVFRGSAGTDIWNGGTNVGYDLFLSVPSVPQVCSARDDALAHRNKRCNREDRLLIGAGSWRFLCC